MRCRRNTGTGRLGALDSRLGVDLQRSDGDKIAVHLRMEPGRFSTPREFIDPRKISGVEKGAAWLLCRVTTGWVKSTAWAEAMIQARGVEGVRVLIGLLNLLVGGISPLPSITPAKLRTVTASIASGQSERRCSARHQSKSCCHS